MTTTDRTEHTFIVGDRVHLTPAVAAQWTEAYHGVGVIDRDDGPDDPPEVRYRVDFGTGTKQWFGAADLAPVDTSRRPTAPASSERTVPHYWSCNVNEAEWSCRCGQVIRDDDFLHNPDIPEDTLSGDCLAGFHRDVSRPVRKRPGYQSPSTPPTPSRLPEPTEAERDAAVCAAWEDVMRWWELQDVKGTPPTLSPRDYQFDGPGHPTVVFFGGTLNALGRYQGGTPSTLADYRASRSRLLRAKVAASKERGRMRVVVQCQHEDEV